MKQVTLITDGACSGNPGPGGWGVVLRYGSHEREWSGAEAETTNNRMELKAVIEGLKRLREPCEVKVITDSRYVLDGWNQWLPRWQANQWRTADRKAVKNQDLWQALVEAARPHQIQWQWVRGHQGHEDNERADRLARAAIEQVRP